MKLSHDRVVDPNRDPRRGFCQISKLGVQEASDPAPPAATFRFEVGQCPVAFGAEIGVEP